MNDMQTKSRIVQGKLLKSVLILVTLVSAFLIPNAYGQAVPANPPAGQEAAETPADIHVLVGRSLVVRSEENLQRVSVTNPAIAAANVISPTQVLIHVCADSITFHRLGTSLLDEPCVRRAAIYGSCRPQGALGGCDHAIHWLSDHPENGPD